MRLREANRRYLTHNPPQGSATPRTRFGGTPGELCQHLRGRTVRATGHIIDTRYSNVAQATEYYLIVENTADLQVMQ